MPYKPSVKGKVYSYLDIITENQYILSLVPGTAGGVSAAQIAQYIRSKYDPDTATNTVIEGGAVTVKGSKSFLAQVAEDVTNAYAKVSSETRMNFYVVIALILVLIAFYFLVIKDLTR